jgi:hypothetical protein
LDFAMTVTPLSSVRRLGFRPGTRAILCHVRPNF